MTAPLLLAVALFLIVATTNILTPLLPAVRLGVPATADIPGIPAISYAPRAVSHAATKSFRVKDLTDAALVYARSAMDLCTQDRPAGVPLGAHPDRHIAASVAQSPSVGR